MNEPILTTISDEHNIHTLTESQLDVWFQSLTPDRKVALFHDEMEAFPDGPVLEPIIPALRDRFVGLSQIIRVAEEMQQETHRLMAAPFSAHRMEASDASL